MSCNHYFVRRRFDLPDEHDTTAGWEIVPLYDYGFTTILPGDPNYPQPDPEPVIDPDNLFALLWCSKHDGRTISAIMDHLLSDVEVGVAAKAYRLKPRSLSVACSRMKCNLGFPRR